MKSVYRQIWNDNHNKISDLMFDISYGEPWDKVAEVVWDKINFEIWEMISDEIRSKYLLQPRVRVLFEAIID